MTIKMRVLTKFPATVNGLNGVVVTKANGTYTFQSRFRDFLPALNTTDLSQQNVPVFQRGAASDGSSDVYLSVPFLQLAAPKSSGTSVTSLTIAAGTKIFATQTGLAFLAGTRIRASHAAAPSNYMEGIVTDYTGGALTVSISLAVLPSGAGPYTDWNLSVAGEPGAGNMLSSNNLSDVSSTSASRDNLYAAPFDAMAFNGLQINGSFDVSQEKGAASSTTGYLCDGWVIGSSGTMVANAAVVNAVGYLPGLPNILSINIGTAQGSLGAGDFVHVYNRIEGTRSARLAWGAAGAQSLTIGFWTAHHRTGTYSASVRNSANSRSYTFTYTHNVADVFQFNTVTIPGDTTGTWLTDINIGLSIAFTMASGSTFISPSPNTWFGSNYIAATGQVNGVAATSDVFRISGVVALPGSNAPSAARAPLIMRPFDQELILCKRYFEKSYPYVTAVGNAYGTANGGGAPAAYTFASTNFTGISWFYTVTKRGTPTITIYSPFSGTAGKVRDQAAVADINVVTQSIGEGQVFATVNNVAVAASNVIFGHFVADARL